MTRLEEIYDNLVSLQAEYTLYNESDNKKRLNAFFMAIEDAKEQLKAIIQNWDIDEQQDNERYWAASDEADATLIAHLNRRL